ncbi:hypothetical protein BACCAP_04833 [Pseudoflavonifractor capillosus ATCC 29799]|uniref:Uncharacterized protein n=1 Tax=Pseudoflavonifractor capillosus ATCC 29799 TaxID=411467 RepID=A6P2V0_9FIRM|nr:hypothetical protein [Pseudoflavonifractor capillosus]EDM97371.1 hypothetical protein BACCAP_04833 [Pseudoflavonifractor capillosus ATCC 29799]
MDSTSGGKFLSSGKFSSYHYNTDRAVTGQDFTQPYSVSFRAATVPALEANTPELDDRLFHFTERGAKNKLSTFPDRKVDSSEIME